MGNGVFEHQVPSTYPAVRGIQREAGLITNVQPFEDHQVLSVDEITYVYKRGFCVEVLLKCLIYMLLYCQYPFQTHKARVTSPGSLADAGAGDVVAAHRVGGAVAGQRAVLPVEARAAAALAAPALEPGPAQTLAWFNHQKLPVVMQYICYLNLLLFNDRKCEFLI